LPLLFLFLSVATSSPKSLAELQQTGLTSRRFETKLSRQVSAGYLFYLPKDYSDEKKWPLLFYLHGGMGRGDDLEKLMWYPVPKRLGQDGSFPFIDI
jgi:predicted peptidase